MKKILASIGLSLYLTSSIGAPIADFQFKSPAFNGIGYSSHVLTIENQERTRQKAREDAVQAAIDKAAADAKNTNLAKFLNNLESRIYAQISQNVATAMFANNGCNVSANSTCTGSINFQGNTISWARVADAFNCIGSTNGSCILLSVKDPSGSETKIYVPLESFTIPGS